MSRRPRRCPDVAATPDRRRFLARAGLRRAEPIAAAGRGHAQSSRSSDDDSPRSADGALSSSKGTPSRITLEPFSSDRAEDVRVVLNTAFAGHWGARDLQPEPWQAVLGAETFRPDWSWLAPMTGRVVGFVLNSAAPHPEFGSVGWTDQLGVLPEARGRGIAGALMDASLASFERAGLKLAGLGVDTGNPFGAPALYDRLGYRRGFEVHLFTRSEPPLVPATTDLPGT